MSEPVAPLVPHRGRMLLLDTVERHDERSVVCAVTLREGALFVREGRVEATVFIEYMAQAAAAFMGLRARTNGGAVRPGYLLAAREVKLHADGARVGDALTAEAALAFDDGAMAAFACSVRDAAGACLAEGELHVWAGARA